MIGRSKKMRFKEPIDDDESMYGRPDPAAIGQNCAVFRIEEHLVTTVVDVVPGAGGVRRNWEVARLSDERICRGREFQLL